MNFSGRPRAEIFLGIQPAEMLNQAGWLELCLWMLRRRLRFQVSGRSMLPVLKPDDQVFVDPHGSLKVGDIVVARHPFTVDMHLVKKLVSFDEAGRAQLEGLNPEESTDSRTLGAVPIDLILGRVTSRF